MTQTHPVAAATERGGALSAAPARPILRVEGLCKHFPVYRQGFFHRRVGWIKAVDNVSFSLQPGETLGLVGESGSGKTTAGRAILRAIAPTRGRVLFDSGSGAADLASLDERSLRPLRTRMQMIFQDPFASLNPRMTVGDIVGEPLVIHGLARGGELSDRVVAMLRRVSLKPEHRTRYPHAFSGGQRQRIGIARALIMHPSLVIADEAVSALDVSVQAQVINLLQDLQDEMGLTYIFIAHDLSVVEHICDRVAVMYAGRIVEIAPSRQIFENPRHPYTRALLSAVPDPDPDRRVRFAMPGEVADPGNLPPGCAFHPRCPDCVAGCREQPPDLRETDSGRWVACHRQD